MTLKMMTKHELEKLFDEKAIKILEYQIKKNVLSQPEVILGQDPIGLQIPKEYLEQWCVQALEAKPIGAGSYPIDIIKDDWGADIKSLACSLDKLGNLDGGDTGETSLAQKFKEGGENLDSLFINKNYEEIKDKWIEIVKNKNALVMEEKKIKKIYYFIFLRGYKEYYLCGMEVQIKNIDNVTVDVDRTTSSSVFLNGYIDSRYGYTKIYKAKKRLELRLKAKNIVEDDLYIKLSIPDTLAPVNLRDVDLKEYFNKILTLEQLI